jgi:acyl-CoA reductase-like NAD-dependent aldehyde dehydrogenase
MVPGPHTDTVSPFVDGRRVESRSDERLTVIDPSNGKQRLVIPRGCEEDVARAVISARCAFDARWRTSPPSLRKKVLERWAVLIEKNATLLNTLDAEEMGKPVSEVLFGAVAAARLVKFYAEAVDKLTGDVYVSDELSFVAQRRIARGVVAAIVPWNFPTYNATLKVAPALAAGNCVVLKPSEMSSRSAIFLAELAIEAGLPPGIFNVVPGSGDHVGRALGLQNGIDMISFTGSTEVGKAMLQYAGQSNMKVVLAECGGKSPQIVFSDVGDLNGVAESVARSILTNQGQVCSAGSRLLVERVIEVPLVERICMYMTKIVMGNALDPSTTFGPISSARQCERVMRYIETAQNEGVQLVQGGRRALLESGGFFVEPTLFRGVSPDSKIAQEEIFGPVLSVIPFDGEDEAIKIANHTVYGLIAYVWTGNLSTGMRMANELRSTVIANASAPRGEGSGHAASYEPAGQSGFGAEGGLAGMESYLRRQLICLNHA